MQRNPPFARYNWKNNNTTKLMSARLMEVFLWTIFTFTLWKWSRVHLNVLFCLRNPFFRELKMSENKLWCPLVVLVVVIVIGGKETRCSTLNRNLADSIQTGISMAGKILGKIVFYLVE